MIRPAGSVLFVDVAFAMIASKGSSFQTLMFFFSKHCIASRQSFSAPLEFYCGSDIGNLQHVVSGEDRRCLGCSAEQYEEGLVYDTSNTDDDRSRNGTEAS